MATINGEEDGETRSSRLQVFLSSLFSSLGGVFGGNGQEIQDLEMTSKAVAVVPQQEEQQRPPKGAVPLPSLISSLLLFCQSWFRFLSFPGLVPLCFAHMFKCLRGR